MPALARHALPTLIETTAVPILTFSIVVPVCGIRAALAVNLGWSTAVFGRHLATDRRVPGTMVVGAANAVARCFILVLGGGAFLFFAQPVIGTIATALAFVGSSVTGRPLAALLGADFIPVPSAAWREPRVREVCQKLSRVWGIALLANATETLWILRTYGPTVYMTSKLVIAATTTLPAVAISAIIARRTVALKSS